MTDKTKSKIAIFDLDETLLAGDSSRLWTNYLWDKKIVTDPQFLKLDEQMIADYYAETLDIKQYLFQHLAYFRHYDINTINRLVNDFTETKIQPLLYPQGISIITQYRQQNIPVMIISATMSFLVHVIAKQLNADISMGIDMQIKDNHYTGFIEGIPTFREGKVERLNQWKEANNIKDTYVYFYTDSSNDLPLCYQADHVITVNADPKLVQISDEQAWGQQHWNLNK
ncbi:MULTISPECIES: HAD family hydrolase [Enterobacterales]|uniref:HAD family hydrolase n=1 Tax=Enterobacterales TaxID=91347 RepID=UPI000848328A|nr:MULTISPECIES: HAD family hydrolase [Enterobacterales]ODQ05980.1 HAD family hydrolase [Shigella sp. FC130]OEI93906.1 HAD family hydrolase [Shigella sp. FC1655]WOO49523.1 HAD family hydrolase [Hafnia alvei]WPF03988.1 HAD family hydrolase [Proteus vulgaris]